MGTTYKIQVSVNVLRRFSSVPRLNEELMLEGQGTRVYGVRRMFGAPSCVCKVDPDAEESLLPFLLPPPKIIWNRCKGT